ncbi:MAG TPA: ATP synthase subunit I [Spirillospora sp.]|nr:ATP synthase subunit I [Spirillospora sp.]
MMNEVPGLVLALIIGAGLGAIFFGGLWLTLLRLPAARWPVPLMLGSLVGRMAVIGIGFYLTAAGSWLRLIACLLGFILMRQFLIRWAQPAQLKPLPLKEQ